MAQLRQDYHEFVQRDTQVLVIGPDSAGAFQRYWRDHDLPFIGLPDPSHKVLDRFGQEVKLLRLGRMPAQVIVDRQGIVRYAHYGRGMMDIPDNRELLSLIDEINQQAAHTPGSSEEC